MLVLDWSRFVLGCALLWGVCVFVFVFGLDCVCLLGCATLAESVAGGHPAYFKFTQLVRGWHVADANPSHLKILALTQLCLC